MTSLFKNITHQEFFDKHGYLLLRQQFLNESDIDDLREFLRYSGLEKQSVVGFDVSMEHENKDLVRNMMQMIEKIAAPKIAPILQNNKLFIASYLSKDPNEKGVILPHQDWTFVEDEENNYSFTCWIPLVDVNEENGCMGIIKGTQNVFNYIRPAPASKVINPLQDHLYTLIPYLELMPMKAGELLIFNNKVFHASLPNLSERKRDAIGLVYTQKKAEFRHYYLKPFTTDTLLKYEVDVAFFQKYDSVILNKMYENGQLITDYKLLEEVRYECNVLPGNELIKIIEKKGNKRNVQLEEKMRRLYPESMKPSLKRKMQQLLSSIKPF